MTYYWHSLTLPGIRDYNVLANDYNSFIMIYLKKFKSIICWLMYNEFTPSNVN